MDPAAGLAWLLDQTTSVALVVTLALLVFLALWRRVLVLGWVYQRERERADHHERLSYALFRQIAKLQDIEIE